MGTSTFQHQASVVAVRRAALGPAARPATLMASFALRSVLIWMINDAVALHQTLSRTVRERSWELQEQEIGQILTGSVSVPGLKDRAHPRGTLEQHAS